MNSEFMNFMPKFKKCMYWLGSGKTDESCFIIMKVKLWNQMKIN